MSPFCITVHLLGLNLTLVRKLNWLHATGGKDTMEECLLSWGFVNYKPHYL